MALLSAPPETLSLVLNDVHHPKKAGGNVLQGSRTRPGRRAAGDRADPPAIHAGRGPPRPIHFANPRPRAWGCRVRKMHRALLLILALAGSAPAAQDPLSPEAAAGKVVYQKKCQNCHGPRGEGSKDHP